MPEIKRCPKCNKNKPLSEFYKRRNGKSSGYCKLCQGKYNRLWNEINLTAERQRVYMFRHRYGLSDEDIANLPKECQICGVTDNLHIDHDHDTGLVRGVLCRKHNIGLGFFDNDINALINAIEYLKMHHESTKGV